VTVSVEVTNQFGDTATTTQTIQLVQTVTCPAGQVLQNGICVTPDPNNVPYLNAAGNPQPPVLATVLTGAETILHNGWYVCPTGATVNFEHTLTILDADINLILADGCKMTVNADAANSNAAISVSAGNKLTVYAQSTGAAMGSLRALVPNDSGAGIGQGGYGNAGTIIINGGLIEARGGGYGAGIGSSGYGASGSGSAGTIGINSGTVAAYGGNAGGPGIGGKNGDITISGNANVSASGGASTADGGGAGIGSRGYSGASDLLGTIVIDTIGTVNATGGASGTGRAGAAIGAGGNSSQGIDSFIHPANVTSATGAASLTCTVNLAVGGGTTVDWNSWQRSTDGGLTWQTSTGDIMTKAGASTTLQVTAGANGNLYRCQAVVTATGLSGGVIRYASRPALLTVGDQTAFKQKISAGTYHTCAIASDDLAYCWGGNGNDQLGNNSPNSSSVPVAVDISGVLANKTIKQIAADGSHACVIASDDRAYCWGDNVYGELGDNSLNSSSVPVAVDTSGVLAGKVIKQIAVGPWNTCAIASDDRVYCWGYYRGLGNNSQNSSRIPVAVNTSGVLAGKAIKQVAVGNGYTCSIASDNLVYCWGDNYYGELGNNSQNSSFVPVAIDISGALAGKTIKRIAADDLHACVIASDDQAYCWGDNYHGLLGNNSQNSSSVPVAVDISGVLAGKTIKQIAPGSVHTCAIASDDRAYCWGDNYYGELGNNSQNSSLVPVAVDTSGVLAGKTIKQITAGGSHVCAIASDDLMYCWGRNESGQLGNNSVINASIPVTVVNP
jgi:alpha-tubulin suppressor-like RCC1 family protein